MTGRVANRHFSRAFRWQRRFLYVFIATIVGLFFDSPLANSPVYTYGMLLLSTCAAIAILAVCYYVYNGSVSSRGVFYSVMHVGLIILLIPVCCLGVFVIPILANGDVLRLRDWDRQHADGT